MASTLSPSEEAQLAQTIEMFEVITQSQPQDYQSLEILKEAYSKLNREKDVINTSKRIALAGVALRKILAASGQSRAAQQKQPQFIHALDASVSERLTRQKKIARGCPGSPASGRVVQTASDQGALNQPGPPPLG